MHSRIGILVHARAAAGLVLALAAVGCLAATAAQAAAEKKKEVHVKKSIVWKLPQPNPNSPRVESGSYTWSYIAQADDNHIDPTSEKPAAVADRSGNGTWTISTGLLDDRTTGQAGGDPEPSSQAWITFSADASIGDTVHAEVKSDAVSQIVDEHVDGTPQNDHRGQIAQARADGSMTITTATVQGHLISGEQKLRTVIEKQELVSGQRSSVAGPTTPPAPAGTTRSESGCPTSIPV
jgi:hypothetical protein